MTRGRKPNTPVEILPAIDPALDQEKISSATVAMRSDALTERQEHDTGIFDLGRQVGALQMARVQTEFLAVASIRLFEQIKESNKYKDLPIRQADGSLATARNLQEFCGWAFGFGYAQMMDKSKDLAALGDANYDAANRLGLNRRQLRLIRTLPDDQRAAVQVALQSESKAEVVAVIEDLAAKLAETQQQLDDEKADHEGTNERLTKRADKINALENQLRRVKAAPPDKILAELQKETTTLMHDTRASIIGGLRNGFLALSQHHENQLDGSNSTVFMAGIMGQLGADLRALCEEFNIDPLQGEAKPEWLDGQAD